MSCFLLVCEKPDAAAKFAKALGGYSGVFDGKQYVVTSLAGHVMELVDPSEQVAPGLSERYKKWDLANLPWHESDFAWKRSVSPGKKKFLDGVKEAAASCDSIVFAGDVDPSGEGFLITAEALEYLGLTRKKLYRMYFEDDTPLKVQKAFREMKPVPDMYRDREYVMAVQREKWDFLSMQFTRVATICGDGRSVLRQGRLKSAMVVLVGDALKALAEYKKVPFYENRFRDENGNMFTNPDEPRFPEAGQVPQQYHPSGVVVDKQEVRHTAPPKLLDLAALSAKLEPMGHAPKTVLGVYQKLYEAHYVSYPRTEDKFISPEQFKEMLPLVGRIAGVVGVDPGLLTHAAPRKTHVKPGGAHGANRPGVNVPASLESLKPYGACAPAIYEILARNYLAMLCEDYEYLAQAGHLKDYPKFTGGTAIPQKPGWKAVFRDDWSDEGDTSGRGFGKTASPFVFEGFPKKPPTPTWMWLSKQLESRDVGTGATRSSTYAEVTDASAKYPLLAVKKGRISMSPYGEMSYTLLQGTHIGDLGLTERIYKEIRLVADGKGDSKAYLDQVEGYVLDDIRTMQGNAGALRQKTGGMPQAADAERFTGVWAGQEVSVKRVWGGHRFTDEEARALLDGREIEFSAVSAKGVPYVVKGVLSAQEYKGHKFVGFEKTGFGGSGVPASLCGHKFTAKERKDLEAGKEILVANFVSSKNKKVKYSAFVRWGKKPDGTAGWIPYGNGSIMRFPPRM